MSLHPLPRPAQAKFAAVIQAAADAGALAHVVIANIKAKQDERMRLVNALDSQPPERRGEVQAAIMVIDSELQSLEAVRVERLRREAHAVGIVRRIATFLEGLPADVFVETEERPPPQLKEGETPADALARVRDEIADLQQQLHATSVAPLPQSDLKKQARDHVQSLARRGKPTIRTSAGQCEFIIRSRGDAMSPGMTASDTLALLAWLDPDSLIERFEALIDAMPSPGLEPLSADEAASRKRSLPARILECERDEETLVEMMLQTGQTVTRREADARALLGVKVVKRAEKAA